MAEGGADVTGPVLRALVAAVQRCGRALPADRREWVEALLAETAWVRGRRRQVTWVLGGFAVLAREVTREVVRMRPWGLPGLVAAVLLVPAVLVPSVGPVPLVATVLAVSGAAGGAALLRRRVGRWPWPAPRPATDGRTAPATQVVVTTAVAAVAALTAVVIGRYPEAASGSGAPLYGTLLALLLAGYLVVSVLLARTDPVAARHALVAGLVSGALWTLGAPAGARYDVSSPWLGVLYGAGLVVALVAPPLLVAVRPTRRDGAVERGVLAGAATGMYAALANLLGGLALVLALPERVPIDSAVLARHDTAAAILAASVGEDLVSFVGLLLLWPIAAAGLAAVAGGLRSGLRHHRRPALG